MTYFNLFPFPDFSQTPSTPTLENLCVLSHSLKAIRCIYVYNACSNYRIFMCAPSLGPCSIRPHTMWFHKHINKREKELWPL